MVISKRNALMSAGIVLCALGASGIASAAEIPVSFHGAGCNLKYTYTRTPAGDATGCVSAKAGRKEGDGHDNDNFIRITNTGVAGVEWACDVKSVIKASENEFTFAGACSDEGSEFTSTVTLLMRPGRHVILDQDVDGRHIVDIYRLRDNLK